MHLSDVNRLKARLFEMEETFDMVERAARTTHQGGSNLPLFLIGEQYDASGVGGETGVLQELEHSGKVLM